MAYETKPDTGTLFKNDRKGDNERAPNAKGKALIGGAWYWVSAWTKDTRDGGKYQSLQFEAMTPEQVAQYAGSGGRIAQQVPTQHAPARQPAAPQRGSARPRSEDQMPPFGEDKVFADADIPFSWGGRDATPV